MELSTLYEIDAAILECVDNETGEILDGERLAELQMERDQKIESVALWYKHLLSDAAQYKAEKDAFAEKEKKAKKKAEDLKVWLAEALAGEKFKTIRVGISYRKSEQAVVDDLFAIDENYLKYKDPEPDLVAIKAAIKAGEAIQGCHIEERQNIQIK